MTPLQPLLVLTRIEVFTHWSSLLDANHANHRSFDPYVYSGSETQYKLSHLVDTIATTGSDATFEDSFIDIQHKRCTE
ncbi:unnamed protein product [Medioppia subpectinata]|uniref:Uncharacterized protein n=1 Tax=Medioppia subpectinata TaxID=1979941 RepID=A0A7R9L510_9ACAR|nr:unnamed protein product [Medioppia subpectinata]CAG2114502.1 unnamed protein product [Medioppia subpectinata]